MQLWSIGQESQHYKLKGMLSCYLRVLLKLEEPSFPEFSLPEKEGTTDSFFFFLHGGSKTTFFFFFFKRLRTIILKT